MLLRVRSPLGVWRIECDPSWTIRDLKRHIATTRHLDEGPLVSTPMSRDPKGQQPLADNARLSALNLNTGDMLHLHLNEEDRSRMSKASVLLFLFMLADWGC